MASAMVMGDLAQLSERLRRARRTLDRTVGEARAVAAQGKRLTAEIAELREQVELHTKAGAVLASIGEQRQADAQRRIETLVTQGLHKVFGDDLTFHLLPGTRAKTPVVDFVVRSHIGDTTVETDVMEARGGGLAVTIGFLLNLVILLLAPDRQETVLFLDETFAFLSEDRHEAMAQFLRELTDKTGVQIVLVTHTPALATYADRIYRFTQTNGVTSVTAG
jgi:DNA repair exonuclease SbcCD ATPase subunit